MATISYVMKQGCLGMAGAVLTLVLLGCSSRDQEKAKAEIREDARQVADGAKKAGAEIKRAVKPGTETASDKLENAALLTKVKAKLASDVGVATISKIDVSISGSVVTLAGAVSSAEQKKAAGQAASQVGGVSRVHNSLVVTER